MRQNGHDDLAGWIDDLRRRLGRGELARLAPLDLGDGPLPTGELTVRVLLADLSHLDWLARHAPDTPDLAFRRGRLRADFRQLRALIG